VSPLPALTLSRSLIFLYAIGTEKGFRLRQLLSSDRFQDSQKLRSYLPFTTSFGGRSFWQDTLGFKEPKHPNIWGDLTDFLPLMVGLHIFSEIQYLH
jgi:hypothetical protein